MRLLQRHDTGTLSLTEDLIGDDTIPPYAILSHTWVEGQEVTFQDFIDGTGKSKAGYDKLRFCADQAKRDGLQHFWVDTCCIDKSNHAELSREINSMFRHYRNASRCYVYLSDVSTICSDKPWEELFRASRWFTRGWTLQELLAPLSVEFFSINRKRLGDKESLEKQIHEITGVPKLALKGARLSEFSVDVRFSWAARRQTMRPEDQVYSMLGIFDIQMPLYYGEEGAEDAHRRLQELIDKREKCMQDLRISDPHDDKKRIEDTKGGLLEDSYCWILANSDFQLWRNARQNALLWVKGDPGKGKTMLLCGAIDELDKTEAKTGLLCYFFCQATDARINTATAVLRGLIYMLVRQQPSLISHVRKKYDQAGKKVFEDANAWFALREIFVNMLQDPDRDSAYLVIDALDECIEDLPRLLDLIKEQSGTASRIKWIISSRNWPQIEQQLDKTKDQIKLSLELNTRSVSKAINIYTEYKVSRLAQYHNYDDDTRSAILQYLLRNADGTFLWVALICQSLEKVQPWDALDTLNQFPHGLDLLYKQMLEQTRKSSSADACQKILATMMSLYRPVALQELTSLVDLPSISNNHIHMSRAIGLCGSFLTIRDNIIFFVHQSAKDFLLNNAIDEICPGGQGATHRTIFTQSIHVMSRALRRDIYGLQAPDYTIENIKPPDPDPLSALRYACVSWIDHVCDWLSTNCDPSSDDWSFIHAFIQQKYLYWLEALSLCRSMSEGVLAITKLHSLMQEKHSANSLIKLVQDAYRFILYHKQAIEGYPLQAYSSALIFSPKDSLIRHNFQHENRERIEVRPMIDDWGPCLQTLEGHGGGVWSVAVSGDSRWVVTGSEDRTAKIWDADSGRCLQTLEGHDDWVRSVAVSGDSRWVVTGSEDRTAKIWDADSGRCLQTLEGHDDWVRSVAVSGDSRWVVTGSWDRTAKIWDADSGRCLQTLEGHGGGVRSVAVSGDSRWVVTGSGDRTAKIWDADSGRCLQTLEVGTILEHMSFDITGHFVTSDIGPLYFEVLSSSPIAGFIPANEGTWKHALGLNGDGKWITAASENVVWLPSDYRPLSSAVLRDLLAVGGRSGKVWIGRVVMNDE